MLSTLKGINEVRSYVTRTAFTRHVEHEISHWPLQAWLNFGKRWQCLQKARPTLSDVDDETNYRMGRLIVVSLALRCTRACAMHPTSGEVSGDVGICRHCTRAMNGVLRERSSETAFFFTCRDYEGRPHLRLRTLLQVFSHRTKLLFAAELVHQQPVTTTHNGAFAAAESKKLPSEMSNLQVQRKEKKTQARTAAAT